MDTFPALLTLCEGNPRVTDVISITKASEAELWCFLRPAPEQTVEQTIGGLRHDGADYDVTVMG